MSGGVGGGGGGRASEVTSYQEEFGTHSIKIRLMLIIIHQIFSLARDWSKRVTWANIPQLKLGNIRGYSPIFKTARVA